MLSIDSPPRYFSATLPPPKTKMHAASTQVTVIRMTESPNLQILENDVSPMVDDNSSDGDC